MNRGPVADLSGVERDMLAIIVSGGDEWTSRLDIKRRLRRDRIDRISDWEIYESLERMVEAGIIEKRSGAAGGGRTTPNEYQPEQKGIKTLVAQTRWLDSELDRYVDNVRGMG